MHAAGHSLGLHQYYYDIPAYLPVYTAVSGIQQGQGETMRYLTKMGVDAGIMVYYLITLLGDLHVLVDDELIASNQATGISDCFPFVSEKGILAR